MWHGLVGRASLLSYVHLILFIFFVVCDKKEWGGNSLFIVHILMHCQEDCVLYGGYECT
jgi:hypothetical protein